MKAINVRNVIKKGRDDMLFLGTLKLQKSKHGFRLTFFNEGEKLWDKSGYIRYIYPLSPGNAFNPTLVAYDAKGFKYYFDCCGTSAEKAIDRLNEIVGLTW